MSVSDTYNDAQGANSNLPSTGLTQWSPVPSVRTTSSVGGANAVVAAGQLILTSDGTDGGQILYDIVPQDFSNYAFISQTATMGGANTDLLLTLTDNTLFSETVQVSPVGLVWTWLISSFVTVDLTNILSFQFTSDPLATGTDNIDQLSSALVCVARDTKVLMADKTEKSIQDIKRGEEVSGDLSGSKKYKVARVTEQIISPNFPLDILRIKPPLMGLKRSLTITANHPIVFNGTRKPAKSFAGCKGVTHYNKKSFTRAPTILPQEPDGKYKVYDLQFETDGTYVANGLMVQSRCPRSEISPLPKDLYFDQKLWTAEVVWDVVRSDYPLDNTPVNPKHPLLTM